jgi:hypothetical protein
VLACCTCWRCQPDVSLLVASVNLKPISYKMGCEMCLEIACLVPGYVLVMFMLKVMLALGVCNMLLEFVFGTDLSPYCGQFQVT